MDFFRRLAALWRTRPFRQIVLLRLFAQGGDAALQVGMAAYLLLNPQTQPNGLSIAFAMTIMVLPFSLVGPFISPILDRFARTQIVLVSDICRVILSLAMGVLVLCQLTTGAGQVTLFVLLLVALSINRLQLAAISAGLPLAIGDDEYVEAMSVVPMIGPASAVLAGIVGGGLRLALADSWPAHRADALVFALAAILFTLAIIMSLRMDRHALGPTVVTRSSMSAAFRSIWDAVLGLRQRPIAAQGILTQTLSRHAWGALTVLAILVFRQHFNTGNLNVAILGLGGWFAVSGVGFAVSGALAGPLVTKAGLRKGLIILLCASAIIQLLPALWLHPLTMIVSGFGLGLTVQSVKACCDTLVQAHTDDEMRGRVMVGYDIANNLGFAVGALIAGALLPADGDSPLTLVVIAGWYLAIALLVTRLSASHRAAYERGTSGFAADPRGDQH